MARNPSSTGGPSTPRPGDDQFSGPDRPAGSNPGAPWPGGPQPGPGGAPYGTGGPPYGPGGPNGPGGGGPRKQRMHPATIAAIAVIAAALGAILVLVLTNGPGSTPSASSTPSSPASSAPAQSGTSGGGSSSGVGIPGAPPEIFMAGRVLAISGTSITIGGPSHTIKADITSATKFNGKAKNAGAVKVGDIVTAQIDNTKNPAVVTSLQDPAQIP